MKTLMSAQAHEIFVQLAKSVQGPHEKAVSNIYSLIELESSRWIHTTANQVPEKYTEQVFEEKLSHLSKEERCSLKISLAALLALKTPKLVESENLPDSILAFYPAAFERMANGLKDMSENLPNQPKSPLVKYARFVFALTVPCGAEDFDLNDRIPLSSCILAVARERSVQSLFNYVRCRGKGVWLRSHTNTEYLDEFNEEGFDRYYLRIAELLIRRKHVRGLVSSSWFHDPQLLEISPRLSFLQTRPLERGAYLMRHRGSEKDLEFATRTSGTRRRLYEEGKYVPTMYSMIWGRKELISWAKSV
ncbi:hypothetical protein A7E78_11650 [Syntrophotalea acetylenivorans]|uniref:Uncharacterized protein n=1 Tax=Syntrophotalea acetylenivorans TaxID=1842532 RepID=A0A1L3GR91_9BACT|nr:hypothetical protein [Syntrophotalea acetylenivorans]APG28444.1 hypothetical protein A7E78_11650 [Syntrophotalea acetylenivorans]